MPLGRSAAAASSLTPTGSGAINAGGAGAQQWQWDIWGFYDTAGPLKFSGMYRGNMYRRVRLGIGVRPKNDPDGIPLAADDILDPDKPDVVAPPGVPIDLIRQAQTELGRIRGKFGKQAILYDVGVNLSIAGECRLAVLPDAYEPGGELWQVYSVIELRQAGLWPDGTPRWTETGPPARVLPQGTIVWRIHNPHPGRHAHADSSAMGVISDLRELELIGKQFRSLVKSRVAQSGIIVMASELGMGRPADPTNPDGPSKLAWDLTKQASTAIRNEEAASNVVPIIVEGPIDVLAKGDSAFKFVEMTRPADQLLDEREDRKLRSFAIGMDTPPETILGIGDVNHWNGAQVSEDSWKAHGEPGMLTICGQLTGGPVRSMLAAAAMYAEAGGPNLDVYGMQVARWTPQQIAQIVVIHDAAAVVSRPDRGKDAKDLHDRYALSNAALRESTNFSEADAPDPDETDERVERERILKTRDAPVQAIPPGYVAGPVGKPGQILPGAPDAGTAEPRPAATQLGQTVSSRRPATAAPARTAALRSLVSARVAPAQARPSMPTASRTRRDPGVRLADIDRQLFSGIQAAAQAAIRRTLERHGSIIRNRSKRDRAVNGIATAVRPQMVAAALGPAVVASLGVTEDDLDVDYAELLDDVDRRVERARAAGLAALIALAASYGQTLTDAQVAEYEASASAASAAGRAWLDEALTGLTRERLYEPGEDGRIVGPGEGLEDGSVPPGVIRRAMSVYGGQRLDANGLPLDDDPYRGVAAGADNLSVGSLLGIETDAWQWAHGSPANPFEPHEDLDGEIFEGDAGDDRRDNTTDRWIGSGEYFPGDHQGCTCWAIPLISPPEG